MEYNYDFNKIEQKWQKNWEKSKIFEVKDNTKKKKFYVLDMFPYPSALGLHMGHAFVFSLGDIFARFKRLQGFNVLYPIGYDALGLPAENAAIQAKIHPLEYTKNSIKNFMKQQKAMGWSYDWNRLINTSEPNYYKWDQWIFLKMLEKGIAYRKKAPVNWCSKCESVLANEQVVNGCCWRHEDTFVEIKHLEQWFLKITNYAEELLRGLEKLDWPENAKKLQKNWIGKSSGTEIDFEIINSEKSLGKWQIFTTRSDTVYGITFMVVSAQHSRLEELIVPNQKREVENFLKKLKGISEKQLEDMEKEGVFTGSYAINPLTLEKIPIYVGNFVVADYGSGMVMAVPAHDFRDFEFAKKYSLPVKVVINSQNSKLKKDKIDSAYVGEGNLINSGEFNGLNNKEAIEAITLHLEKKKLGRRKISYKLRDWLISRQRYWGTPIPVIYCEKCGIVPVPEKDLPVVLPKKVEFGKGNPLLTNESWLKVKCPKCRRNSRRETDTMDTFANSSWYYLRYTDPNNNKKIFDSKKANYWAPIDQYIGGPEHITAHLIYARFYTKFLRDLEIINFNEPALRYFTQGIVHASDGEKMSKSKGNVVEPLNIIKKYGADTLRLALVSIASSDKNTNWDEKIVIGSHKFLNKVYNYFANFKKGKINSFVESKLNKTIQKVTDYVQNFKYNLAVIELRELFSVIEEQGIDKKNASKFLVMLHLFCPFITEELFSKLGFKKFLSLFQWPEADESKIDEKLEEQELALDKLAKDIRNILGILELRGEKGKKIARIYSVPQEMNFYKENTLKLEKSTSLKIEIYSVKDAAETGKQIQAKPGKPGIYLE